MANDLGFAALAISLVGNIFLIVFLVGQSSVASNRLQRKTTSDRPLVDIWTDIQSRFLIREDTLEAALQRCSREFCFVALERLTRSGKAYFKAESGETYSEGMEKEGESATSWS